MGVCVHCDQLHREITACDWLQQLEGGASLSSAGPVASAGGGGGGALILVFTPPVVNTP